MTPELTQLAIIGGAGGVLLIAFVALVVSSVRGSRERKRLATVQATARITAVAEELTAVAEVSEDGNEVETATAAEVADTTEAPAVTNSADTTAILAEIEPEALASEEEPARYSMAAPAELWFDELHLGVKEGSSTARRLRYYADILLDEVSVPAAQDKQQ